MRAPPLHPFCTVWYEATGTRRSGIYRLWGAGRADWFCDTFAEWLRRFVEREGRLDEDAA